MSKRRFQKPVKTKKKHGPKIAAVVMTAGFIGHHSLEVLAFKAFEYIGHHIGLAMAVTAFIGLAILIKTEL